MCFYDSVLVFLESDFKITATQTVASSVYRCPSVGIDVSTEDPWAEMMRHHTGMTMGLTSHHVLSNGPLSYLQQPDSQSSEGFQSRRYQQKPREETRLQAAMGEPYLEKARSTRHGTEGV